MIGPITTLEALDQLVARLYAHTDQVSPSDKLPPPDGHVLMWDDKTNKWRRKIDCQPKVVAHPSFIKTTPMTDDEREAALREHPVFGDVIFLLRRLDELRSVKPAATTHDWIARLNGPFVPAA